MYTEIFKNKHNFYNYSIAYLLVEYVNRLTIILLIVLERRNTTTQTTLIFIKTRVVFKLFVVILLEYPKFYPPVLLPTAIGIVWLEGPGFAVSFKSKPGGLYVICH